MTTSWRARGAALAAAATALATAVSGSAAADPLGDARSRAAALARTVDDLQTRAEIAIEHYDAIQERLGRAVVRQSLAERQAERDAAAAATQADAADRRVRALYESGGQAGLVATVLDGSTPADALVRLHLVGTLLEFGQAEVTDAARLSDRAAHIADGLTAQATEVTRLQTQAAAAAARVRSLLADRRAALAGATAEVRRLVAERQAALAAASAQAFAAAVGDLPAGVEAPNDVAAAAIAAARSRLGVPYVWGATGPNSFDCSGLTQWAYAHAGIQLPRVAADQWNVGEHVPVAQLQPGDLLFWASDLENPATIHHVAMYVGGGLMVAAPHTGDVVKVQPVYLSGFIGATRPYTAGS